MLPFSQRYACWEFLTPQRKTITVKLLRSLGRILDLCLQSHIFTIFRQDEIHLGPRTCLLFEEGGKQEEREDQQNQLGDKICIQSLNTIGIKIPLKIYRGLPLNASRIGCAFSFYQKKLPSTEVGTVPETSRQKLAAGQKRMIKRGDFSPKYNPTLRIYVPLFLLFEMLYKTTKEQKHAY